MSIKPTNWTQNTQTSTNWAYVNGTVGGSPIGLLLALTYPADTSNTFATDWSGQSIAAQNWANDELYTNEIGLQNGDTLVLQTGGQLLIA